MLPQPGIPIVLFFARLARNPVSQVRAALTVFLVFLLSSCGPKEKETWPEPVDPAKLLKGDTIAPFAFIHPENYDWKIEVRVSGDDLYDVAHKRLKIRYFWTTEEEVLEKIRKLRFVYGKPATHKASSTMRIFQNGKLIEKYGLILEKNAIGLQSQKLGFIEVTEPEHLFETLEHME